ncbi:hypothetical protein MNBD_GAMMA01-1752, partial [hydrothermal vent metagenome]
NYNQYTRLYIMNTPSLTQKIITNSKLAIAVLVTQISLFGTANALEVSINGSSDLSLNGGIIYDYNAIPSTVSFQVNSPFACTSISNSNEPMVLNVDDANGIPISTMNDGVLSVIYDLSNNRVNIVTDNSIQCASTSGLHQEIIYIHGFEAGVNDLQLTLLDGNGVPFANSVSVVDLQVLDYQYVVENNGGVPLAADLVEFFKIDPAEPFFSGVSSSDWVCNTVTGSTTTTTCGSFLQGDGTVNLKNAVVDPGEQLVIDVSRTVNVPNGTVGTGIDLLAAAFATNNSDTFVDNNVTFKTFATSDNNPPTISTITNKTILEDSMTSVINFTVSDVETNNGSLIVTAASSNTSIVPVSGIALGGSGSNRTVQITPNADTNTTIIPVTITLTVDDGFTTTQEQFTLTVTPVNDAPSFTLLNIPDWPASTSGLKTLKGFVENLNFGGLNNENSQVILNTTITVQSDPNGIFSGGGEPQLTNNGVLSYVLSGIGGTATIDVTLQDDGGTADGGQDTSQTISFTITVLNTLPTISSVTDDIFDEDGSSSLLNFTISDAETTASALTMSATSSHPSIVSISGIQFSGTGGSRTVQIVPEINENTVVSGDVTITLIVDDGSGTSQTQFNVTINAINDAPSFDIGSDIIWSPGTTGLKQHPGFASNIQMGPTADENNSQSVNIFSVNISSGNSIFASGGEPTFDTSGSLAYLLSGTSGTAKISVTLQDDGGISNGGVDTSIDQSFTITVQ